MSLPCQIIKQAPALFNASFNDILTELLQNSRRAGAKTVKITIEKRDEIDWMIVQDDGIGLFAHGVQITMGASHWQESIQENEHSAGMGLFSLANRGCSIDANQKHIELEPEHFTGSQPVEVSPSSYSEGTSIAFPLLKKDLRFTTIDTVLKQCTEYYPIPVLHQGHVLSCQSFMEGTVYIEEWEGLEIGVFKYGGNSINFHGLTIATKLPTIMNCCADSINEHLSIRINVYNCPHLRLTLPRRREVVQNDFFGQLNDKCLEVLYRYLQKLGAHYLTFAEYNDALKKQIILPPATARLFRYEPKIADTDSFASYDMLTLEEQKQYWLVELDEEPAVEQVFARGFRRAHPGIVLLTPNKDMVGYDWYDRLPKITEAAIAVNYGDVKYLLSEIPSDIVEQRPTSIAMTLVVHNLKDKPQIDTISLDMALWNPDECFCYDDPSNLNVFIPEHSTVNVDTIVDLMIKSFFVYCDDGDADSYDSQKDYFHTEAEFRVMKILDEAKAIEHRIESYVEQYITWLVAQGKQCVITIDHAQLGQPHSVSVSVQ